MSRSYRVDFKSELDSFVYPDAHGLHASDPGTETYSAAQRVEDGSPVGTQHEHHGHVFHDAALLADASPAGVEHLFSPRVIDWHDCWV